MKRSVIVPACLASLVSVTAPAAAQESYTLAASWMLEVAQLGFIVADEKDLYAENGVNVIVERGYGAADTMRRLMSNEIQFAVVDALVMMRLKAADPDMDLVMVASTYQDSPFGLMYVEGRNVEGVEDLRTAVFGDTGGSIAQLYPAFLSAAFGTPASELGYESLSLDPSVGLPALFRGDIDVLAAMAFEEPIFDDVVKEMGLGAGVIRYADHNFNPYTYGIAVQREFAEANPDVVRAVVKASLEGFAFACAEPEETAEILEPYHAEVRPDLITEMMVRMLPHLENAETREHGLGVTTAERWADTYDMATLSWGLEPDAIADPQAMWSDAYMPATPVMANCGPA